MTLNPTRFNDTSFSQNDYNKYLLLGWYDTGNMTYARSQHTASVLTNGKVLVAGGDNGDGYTAELYDPSTEVWNVTSNMTYARYYHKASVLTNGKVLVAGGVDNSRNTLNSAELYQPYIINK